MSQMDHPLVDLAGFRTLDEKVAATSPLAKPDDGVIFSGGSLWSRPFPYEYKWWCRVCWDVQYGEVVLFLVTGSSERLWSAAKLFARSCFIATLPFFTPHLANEPSAQTMEELLVGALIFVSNLRQVSLIRPFFRSLFSTSNYEAQCLPSPRDGELFDKLQSPVSGCDRNKILSLLCWIARITKLSLARAVIRRHFIGRGWGDWQGTKVRQGLSSIRTQG